MADLFGALNTAARSLDAHRYALEVVGHNLANVNTPGYSRRSAVLHEIAALDSGTAGAGVEARGVEAARSPFIERRLLQERPALGRERAVVDQLALVESALGRPGTALDARLNEFFDAFAALAEDPTSSIARRIVSVQGDALAQAFKDLDGVIASARTDVDVEVQGVLGRIDALAQGIANLNVEVVNASTDTVDALLDRRSAALQELSDLVDIGVTRRDDGAIDVTVGNGRALVAGERSYSLAPVPSGALGLADVHIGSLDVTTELTGGTLGGLLQVRDVMVPSYATRLDTLAYRVITEVNDLHTAGFDLDGNPGADFFTDPGAADGAARSMAVSASILTDERLVAASTDGTLTSDNRNARAIADLRNGSPSPIDDWGALVHRVGADRESARTELDLRQDVLDQIEALREQTSGVSIDEEAATLVRFQRAYEANARFFSVVNSLLDQLMANIAR